MRVDRPTRFPRWLSAGLAIFALGCGSGDDADVPASGGAGGGDAAPADSMAGADTGPAEGGAGKDGSTEGGGGSGGTAEAGPDSSADAVEESDAAVGDASDDADAASAKVFSSRYAFTSGGGEGTSASIKVWVSTGAPQPRAVGSSTNYKLMLGTPGPQ